MTKQERHEQAVRDVAMSQSYMSAEAVRKSLAKEDLESQSFRDEMAIYAVSQRERVLELEEEIEVLKASLGYATLEPSAETSDRQIEKWMTKAREFLATEVKAQ